MDARDEAMIAKTRRLSMTDPVARWTLIRAIRFIEAKGIPGDIIECGVWRGGNVAIAGMLRDEIGFDRRIWAYDTFAGMTPPTEDDAKAVSDVAPFGVHAAHDKGDYNAWCYASLEDVRRNFSNLATGELRTVKGPVEQTLRDPANLPAQIAILRLDTDFYESTKAELEILYPRLSAGGFLIIDDYGEWKGARKAVDEYFAGRAVWLQRVDHTVRMLVKE